MNWIDFLLGRSFGRKAEAYRRACKDGICPECGKQDLSPVEGGGECGSCATFVAYELQQLRQQQ